MCLHLQCRCTRLRVQPILCSNYGLHRWIGPSFVGDPPADSCKRLSDWIEFSRQHVVWNARLLVQWDECVRCLIASSTVFQVGPVVIDTDFPFWILFSEWVWLRQYSAPEDGTRLSCNRLFWRGVGMDRHGAVGTKGISIINHVSQSARCLLVKFSFLYRTAFMWTGITLTRCWWVWRILGNVRIDAAWHFRFCVSVEVDIAYKARGTNKYRQSPMWNIYVVGWSGHTCCDRCAVSSQHIGRALPYHMKLFSWLTLSAGFVRTHMCIIRPYKWCELRRRRSGFLIMSERYTQRSTRYFECGLGVWRDIRGTWTFSSVLEHEVFIGVCVHSKINVL